MASRRKTTFLRKIIRQLYARKPAVVASSHELSVDENVAAGVDENVTAAVDENLAAQSPQDQPQINEQPKIDWQPYRNINFK